jgi:hypothetical protein
MDALAELGARMERRRLEVLGRAWVALPAGR